MNNYYTILLFSIFLSCSGPTQKHVPLPQMNLTDYQIKILNPELNSNEEDWQKQYLTNALNYYNIPHLHNGEVSVKRIDENNKEFFLQTLVFKDSLLIETSNISSKKKLNYDSLNRLTSSNGNDIRTYKNNELSKIEDTNSFQTFERIDSCIIHKTNSKDKTFHSLIKYCYKDKNKLTSSEFSITSNKNYTTDYIEYIYNKGKLINSIFIQTQKSDTTIQQVKYFEYDHNNLLKTKGVSEPKRAYKKSTIYEYELVESVTLTIRKITKENGSAIASSIYKFDENGFIKERTDETPTKQTLKYEYKLD